MKNALTRPCRKCGQDFEPTPGAIRHSLWICRPCARLRRPTDRPTSYLAQFRSLENLSAEQRAKIEHRRAIGRKTDEKRRARFNTPEEKQKQRARDVVRRRVLSGKIARQPCSVCGSPNASPHHDDHARIFDVIWLCPKHHTERHVVLRQAKRLAA